MAGALSVQLLQKNHFTIFPTFFTEKWKNRAKMQIRWWYKYNNHNDDNLNHLTLIIIKNISGNLSFFWETPLSLLWAEQRHKTCRYICLGWNEDIFFMKKNGKFLRPACFALKRLEEILCKKNVKMSRKSYYFRQKRREE